MSPITDSAVFESIRSARSASNPSSSTSAHPGYGATNSNLNVCMSSTFSEGLQWPDFTASGFDSDSDDDDSSVEEYRDDEHPYND